MKIAMMLVVGGLLAAAPASAQMQHGQGGHEGKCPMHASHGAGEHGAGEHGAGHGADPLHRNMPEMVLQHASGLKLTPAQVSGLEQLQAKHKADCGKRMAAVKTAEEAAAAAVAKPAPDAATFEAKLREAAGLKVECKVDMLRTGQAALALLTAEQRMHLEHMGHAGHTGHGGH